MQIIVCKSWDIKFQKAKVLVSVYLYAIMRNGIRVDVVSGS